MNEKVKSDSISEDDLVSELWARDVRFMMGSAPNRPPILLPAELISSLLLSNEARLQLSIIPLFLRHPEFSNYVTTVLKKLNPKSQLLLKCFYTASVWLEQKYLSRNQLPDLFSKELGISITPNPEENLQVLAARQRQLSKMYINWLGTYEHAAEVWLKATALQNS